MGSDRKVVALNTTSQIIGKIFSASSTLLVSLIIARSYGATGYGDFTKVTTYVALFYLLADFGLNALYLQKESQGKTTWPTLLGTRLIISALLIFLAISVLAFLPGSTVNGYTPLVRLGIIVFAPTILTQALITTSNAFFQKRFRYDLAAVSVGLGSVIALGLIWFFARTTTQSAGLLLSVLGLGAGSLTTAVASLFFVKKLGSVLTPRFVLTQLVGLTRDGLPLGLTLLFNLVYFRIDSFVLTITRTTAEVGIYGFAYKLFEVPLVIPMFFMNALYPLLLVATPVRFGQLLKKALLTLGALSVVSLLVFWIFAPWVSAVRPEFVASVTVLQILSLGFPLFFVSSLVMWALIALKKQGILVIIYGASMLVTAVLDIYFIPSFGYIAASWITVLAEALVLAMSGMVLLKQLY